MFLTIHIGIPRSQLKKFVLKHSTEFLPKVVHLSDDVVKIRKTLAFYFNIFLKKDANELPNEYKTFISRHPSVLLLSPRKIEEALRWWWQLFEGAPLECEETRVELVTMMFMKNPHGFLGTTTLLKKESEVAWGREGASTAKKGRRHEEGAKARFTLSYFATSRYSKEMAETQREKHALDKLTQMCIGFSHQ